MKEHLINPTKPEEIIKELFNDNSLIINQFANYFSKEILEFSELFSAGYKRYLELDRLLKQTENIQKAYTQGFAYLIYDNLLTSVKLLILGHQAPSGNVMRQAIESVAMAILCSSKDEILIPNGKNRTKSINFFEKFLNKKQEAKSHKSIGYLEFNCNKFLVNKEAVDTLKKSRSFFHNYSHPSELALATTMSFETPERMFICGGFDLGKMKEYKKELTHRINFCRIMPNIIEGLIIKLKQMPQRKDAEQPH